ncbi:hypothetical protein N7461_003073 [Penicillium sp. DV-2018c]|nr:hypothetical protein N7461_003073 [Penicillium sp. DV-2018c]
MSILRNIKSLAPLMDRVLVQRIKPEAKTASGIFLPEAAVKEQNEAQVLAVGPGLLDRDGKRIPMSVNAGDKVLIPQVCILWSFDPVRSADALLCGYMLTVSVQFGGNAVKVGEEEYTLFRDHEYVSFTLPV